MDKKLQTALERWQAIQPISPRDRERLSRRFTVEFNYNSNHIEGNTLTHRHAGVGAVGDRFLHPTQANYHY